MITGYAFTVPDTSPLGFILRGSTYTFFLRPGWDNTQPRAIANSGLITGYSYSDDGSRFAGFIYDPDSDTFTDATPPGSTNTITEGMNKFGRITGHGREVPSMRYGFVWQQGTITKGKRELLPFLDRIKIDVSTSARGINDSGVVAGWFSDATGRGDGFVGSDAQGHQRLVAPGGEMPGNSTYCQGINNFAQVICVVDDSAFNPLGAFIGSPVEGEATSTKAHTRPRRGISPTRPLRPTGQQARRDDEAALAPRGWLMLRRVRCSAVAWSGPSREDTERRDRRAF